MRGGLETGRDVPGGRNLWKRTTWTPGGNRNSDYSNVFIVNTLYTNYTGLDLCVSCQNLGHIVQNTGPIRKKILKKETSKYYKTTKEIIMFLCFLLLYVHGI